MHRGRETEILRLIAAGWTNNEIAAHLFISPLTCKSHVSRILAKLEARDRIQLVVLAYESGLVIPGQAGGLPGAPRHASWHDRLTPLFFHDAGWPVS